MLDLNLAIENGLSLDAAANYRRNNRLNKRPKEKSSYAIVVYSESTLC